MAPPSSTATLPAALTPPEFAVLRCWAEGLDLLASWRRYVAPDAADPREVRARFQQMLESLRRLARSHGRADLAALLRRDPAAIVDRDPAVPTLEAFAATQPPDFYSEAELVELHQARYGRVDARGAARRRQRLRERLLLAVQTLEGLGTPAPQPTDALTRWLDERVAARLAQVGVRTLGELVFWIRMRGFHWHRRVPRLGPRGAARLVAWLGEHEATLGVLPITALAPRRFVDVAALTPAPSVGIAPLERQRCPTGLDGQDGRNRAPRDRCRIEADTDQDAVLAWLARHPPGSHTWRAYRKEAERLLLWSTLWRRKPLSSLDAHDCAAYVEFLAAPAPEWLGSRQTPRGSAGWRPFEGPLSERSRQVAVGVLKALFGWLVRQRYLLLDPWAEPPAPRAAAVTPSAQRALSGDDWAAVEAWLADEVGRDGRPSPQRLRALMMLAVGSGLRLSELAAARRRDLRSTTLAPGTTVWSLQVGGRAAREVPLTPAAAAAVLDYLAAREGGRREMQTGADGAEEGDAALLSHLDSTRPLTPGRLYQVLRAGLMRCAAAVADRDRTAADRLRAASAQWLRHSYGVHAAERALPAALIGAVLGHRHPGQAEAYVAAARQRRLAIFHAAFAAAPADQPASISRRARSSSSASAASLSAPAEKRSSS